MMRIRIAAMAGCLVMNAAAATAQPGPTPTVTPATVHSFVDHTAINGPTSLVAAPDGSALFTSNGWQERHAALGRVRADGPVRRLHEFSADEELTPTLAAGAGGVFYGITKWGDANCGSIFSVGPGDVVRRVYAYTGLDGVCGPTRIVAGTDGAVYVSAYFVSGDEAGSLSILRIAMDASITEHAFTFEVPVAAVAQDGTAYGVRGRQQLIRRTPDGDVAPFAVGPPFGTITSIVTTGSDRLIGAMATNNRCDLFRSDAATAEIQVFYSFPLPTYYRSCDVVWQRVLATGNVFAFLLDRFASVEAEVTAVEVSTATEPVGATSLGPADGVGAAVRMPDGTFWLGQYYSLPDACGVPGPGRILSVDGPVTRAIATLPESLPGTPVALIAAPEAFFGALTGITNPGVIFRLTRDGNYRVIYRFTCGGDGGQPSSLVRTSDGAIFGTTSDGTGNSGTIFRIGSTGSLATLFAFRRPDDGERPFGLVDGRDGYLYGITRQGGTLGGGTLFRLAPTGEFKVLRQFGPYDLRPSRLVVSDDRQLFLSSVFDCSINVCRGSISRVTPQGDLVELASGSSSDPVGAPIGLVAGRDNRLYGHIYFDAVGYRAFVMTTAGILSMSEPWFIPMVAGPDGWMYGFSYDSSGQQFARMLNTTVDRVWRVGPLTGLATDGPATDGNDGFIYLGTPSYEPNGPAIVRLPWASGPPPPSGIRFGR